MYTNREGITGRGRVDWKTVLTVNKTVGCSLVWFFWGDRGKVGLQVKRRGGTTDQTVSGFSFLNYFEERDREAVVEEGHVMCPNLLIGKL